MFTFEGGKNIYLLECLLRRFPDIIMLEAIKKEDFKGKSSKKKSVTFVTPASRLGRQVIGSPSLCGS